MFRNKARKRAKGIGGSNQQRYYTLLKPRGKSVSSPRFAQVCFSCLRTKLRMKICQAKGNIICVLEHYQVTLFLHVISIHPPCAFLSNLELTCNLLCNARPSLRQVLACRSNTSLTHSFLLLRLIMTLKAPQCSARASISPQDPCLDPPRQNGEALVTHKAALRIREDVIKFFQCLLLGLRYQQEDHDECNDVEASVQTKRAGRRERGELARKR